MAPDCILDIVAQGAWNGGVLVDNSIYENKGMQFKGWTVDAVEPDRAFRQLLDEKEERLADGRQAVAELSRKFRDRKPTDSRPAAIEVMASSNPAVYTGLELCRRHSMK